MTTTRANRIYRIGDLASGKLLPDVYDTVELAKAAASKLDPTGFEVVADVAIRPRSASASRSVPSAEKSIGSAPSAAARSRSSTACSLSCSTTRQVPPQSCVIYDARQPSGPAVIVREAHGNTYWRGNAYWRRVPR
jgi:hypothetical protein